MKPLQKAKFPLLLVFTGFSFFSGYYINNTEGVSIGPDNTPPHSSAMLEVFSANKGVLVPRITNTNNIANPANALLVFVENSDAELRGFHYYDNVDTEWKKIGASFKIPQMTYAQMIALSVNSNDIGKFVYVTNSSPVTDALYPQAGNICERDAYVNGLWYLAIHYHNCGSAIQWQRIDHDYGTPTGTTTSNCLALC